MTNTRMMMTKTENRMTVVPGTQEVVLNWTFQAPCQLVFQAHTDPQMIGNWWGPHELTTTVERLDAKSGGGWRFIQRDPDGNVHAFHGVFHEVSPPARIVRTFEYEGAPGRVMLETVTFEERGGRTKITTHSLFQSVSDRDQMVATGMERGVLDSMERLAELMARG
ncbi:MAG: SRPBCC family protein [Candidatus Dormiibacterota bacterium]